MPFRSAYIALGLAAVFASHAQAASIEEGRRFAQRNCSQCHAIGMEGDSPNKAAPPFRTLGEQYDFDTLIGALKDGMLAAHPEMPRMRLDSRQMESLILYLKSVQTKGEVVKASTPRQ